MNRYFTYSIVLCLCLVSSFPGNCGSLVYFDPELAMELISKLDFVENENQIFNQRVETINRELEAKQQDLAQMEKDLTRLKDLEMKKDYDELVEIYNTKFSEFEKFFKESEGEISEKRKKVQEAIENGLISIVNEIAAKNRYDFVIEYGSGNILLADRKWDITEDIVAEYSRRFSSIYEMKTGEEKSPPQLSLSPAETRLYHLGCKYLEENNPDKALIVWQKMTSESGARHYSIAVSSGCDLEELKNDMDEIRNDAPVFLLPMPMTEKTCYRTHYGLFCTNAEAQNALDHLVDSKPQYFRAYILKLD